MAQDPAETREARGRSSKEIQGLGSELGLWRGTEGRVCASEKYELVPGRQSAGQRGSQ